MRGKANSWTVIATTGKRFGDFMPYVASVNDAGTVAFQAEPRDGGAGVFTGTGGAVTEAAGPALLAGAANPASVNAVGHVAVRASLTDGRQLILRADPAA